LASGVVLEKLLKITSDLTETRQWMPRILKRWEKMNLGKIKLGDNILIKGF